MAEWEREFPTSNIGLPLGGASKIVGVDIDTDDPILLERIKKILPTSIVRKKGAKGETAFFRYAGHTSRKFRLHPQGKPIVELLSDGNQTVLPGSNRWKKLFGHWESFLFSARGVRSRLMLSK
jgi:hypothetical protein